jgi:hypothetical protein
MLGRCGVVLVVGVVGVVLEFGTSRLQVGEHTTLCSRKVCPGFHLNGVYVYGDSAEMLRLVRSMQTI